MQTSPIVRKHAFDTISKMMATVHCRGDRFAFAIKGAPEAALAATATVIADDGDSPLASEACREWLVRMEEFAHHGLRLLARAIQECREADGDGYG